MPCLCNLLNVVSYKTGCWMYARKKEVQASSVTNWSLSNSLVQISAIDFVSRLLKGGNWCGCLMGEAALFVFRVQV